MSLDNPKQIIEASNVIPKTKAGKNNNIFILDSSVILRSSYRIFDEMEVLREKLNKIKDNWVGYIYDSDEAVLENLRAEEELVSLLEEKEVEKNKIEYNKNSGYFIINSQNQLFHLTEEQAKEKLKVKKLNLKNPEKIIRKYGEKKEKSTFYKIIDDYFIPFSDNGIGIIGYEVIKYFAILILILRIIYLRKLLKKEIKRKDRDK